MRVLYGQSGGPAGIYVAFFSGIMSRWQMFLTLIKTARIFATETWSPENVLLCPVDDCKSGVKLTGTDPEISTSEVCFKGMTAARVSRSTNTRTRTPAHSRRRHRSSFCFALPTYRPTYYLATYPPTHPLFYPKWRSFHNDKIKNWRWFVLCDELFCHPKSLVWC